MKGKFITIEGTEGAGKSTALNTISNYFNNNSKIVLTREPGGTVLAEEIRNLLLLNSSSETIQPNTELLLMFAGRAQHLYNTIIPALNAGTWVVSDRYVDASYAYQGGGRGIDLATIKWLDQYIVGNWYPDLTLLLDIPAELGLRRTENRGTQKDRIEQEKIDFFERVRKTYLNRAQEDPKRIKIINASLPLLAVQEQMRSVLDNFMRTTIT